MGPFRMVRGVAVALLLVSSLPPVSVRAGVATGWMPSEPGTRWAYASSLGARETLVCTGTVDFGGRPASVNEWVASASDRGLRQYWWSTGSTESSDLQFLGFFRTDSNWGLRYEPPLRFLSGPPAPGNTWIDHVQAYGVPDGDPAGPVDLQFEIVESLALPGWGTSWGVDYSAILPVLKHGGRSFSPFGRDLGASGGESVARARASEPDYGLAFQVGETKYLAAGTLFTLESYDVPVPVQASTWGRIKQLYR